jgi:hypothetical protein
MIGTIEQLMVNLADSGRATDMERKVNTELKAANDDLRSRLAAEEATTAELRGPFFQLPSLNMIQNAGLMILNFGFCSLSCTSSAQSPS